MDSRQQEKFLFLCRAHIISHQPYAQFLQQETQSGMLRRPLEKQRFFFQQGESSDICTVLNTPDKESTSLYTCQALVSDSCCVPKHFQQSSIFNMLYFIICFIITCIFYHRKAQNHFPECFCSLFLVGGTISQIPSALFWCSTNRHSTYPTNPNSLLIL